jgi:malate dehydrogenase (quinone)
MGQSSNDGFPTAMHIAAVSLPDDRLIPALQSSAHRFAMLRHFFAAARRNDWHEAVAGQRAQIIKPDAEQEGVLEFGTEPVVADKSLLALPGASPGAFTAAAIAIAALEKCFDAHLTRGSWLRRLKQIIPPYGIDLRQDADACRTIRAQAAAVLRVETI